MTEHQENWWNDPKDRHDPFNDALFGSWLPGHDITTGHKPGWGEIAAEAVGAASRSVMTVLTPNGLKGVPAATIIGAAARGALLSWNNNGGQIPDEESPGELLVDGWVATREGPNLYTPDLSMLVGPSERADYSPAEVDMTVLGDSITVKEVNPDGTTTLRVVETAHLGDKVTVDNLGLHDLGVRLAAPPVEPRVEPEPDVEPEAPALEAPKVKPEATPAPEPEAAEPDAPAVENPTVDNVPTIEPEVDHRTLAEKAFGVPREMAANNPNGRPTLWGGSDESAPTELADNIFVGQDYDHRPTLNLGDLLGSVDNNVPKVVNDSDKEGQKSSSDGIGFGDPKGPMNYDTLGDNGSLNKGAWEAPQAEMDAAAAAL